MLAESLRHGDSKSCGCAPHKTHGESKTPLYGVWKNMRARCNDPNSRVYKHYGGRGIAVCPEWFDHYETFRDWAMANGWEHGLEIDRIDNNGNYCPENCRIITHKDNTRNTRLTVWLTAWGETKPLPAWLEDDRCVVIGQTIRERLANGWGVELALSTLPWNGPPRKAKTECVNGHKMTEANTRVVSGRRVCKTCSRAAQERYNARQALKGAGEQAS